VPLELNCVFYYDIIVVLGVRGDIYESLNNIS
jgi:hypothetical protein